MHKYYVIKSKKSFGLDDETNKIICKKNNVTLLGYCEGAKELYKFLHKTAIGNKYFGSEGFKEWCSFYTCKDFYELNTDYNKIIKTDIREIYSEYVISKYLIYDYKRGKKRVRNALEVCYLNNKKLAKKESGWYSKWNTHLKYKIVYRKDPVPYTGNSHRGWNLCFRSFCKPKYDATKEQLEIQKEYPDARVKIQRASRNIANMPTAWDDISYRVQRSWKHNRKHQNKYGTSRCSKKELIWNEILKDVDEASF